MSLTTLAASAATKFALLGTTSKDKIRISSVKLAFTWDDATGDTEGNADGPLLVGIAHGDYSSTEIEEFIEAVTSINFADKIAAERSRRLIRVIGLIAPQRPTIPASGIPMRVKLNWVFGEAQTPFFWAYNTSPGVALTTGSQLECVGHANVWRI